ncbi:MAG: HNH endonuclease domain-containing protein [Cyanobacteria bacterium P01_E01_bin.42]
MSQKVGVHRFHPFWLKIVLTGLLTSDYVVCYQISQQNPAIFLGVEQVGKAGNALKQVLETYKISQNQLALALEIDRSMVFRWYHEQVDPAGETIADIVTALQRLNLSAAEEFTQLYLGIKFPREGNLDLPSSQNVDVTILSGLFKKKTNSYKYLFFISLLDILKRRQFDTNNPISFKEIVIEILANAWYPYTYFKLSFGVQDMIAEQLELLQLKITEPILKFVDVDKKILRQTIGEQNLGKALKRIMRYVPFRLIRPFFNAELQGLSTNNDSKVDKDIPLLANENFETYKPLYQFNSTEKKNCDEILIHPKWSDYLQENYSIVRGWAAWHWLQYMQSKNPSVTSISSKIFPPQERESLTKQKNYWKLILQYHEIKCIYSEVKIDPNQISLDHYLPWSFVAHNQLWNLIPTLPNINSSKSDNIPAIQYLDQFIIVQHLGLKISFENMKESQWLKIIESYFSDLKIHDKDDLLNFEILKNAYKSTLNPLISLAKNQGFVTDWRYKDV